MSAFVPNCNHGYAVKYNEFNKVVQCHVCGQVWIPLVTSTDEEYAAKVKIEHHSPGKGMRVVLPGDRIDVKDSIGRYMVKEKLADEVKT